MDSKWRKLLHDNIESSTGLPELLDKMGLRRNRGSYCSAIRVIAEDDLSISHFTDLKGLGFSKLIKVNLPS